MLLVCQLTRGARGIVVPENQQPVTRKKQEDCFEPDNKQETIEKQKV